MGLGGKKTLITTGRQVKNSRVWNDERLVKLSN